MFNLASYLLGYNTSSGQESGAGGAEHEGRHGGDVRLTAVVADDDWVLVERDHRARDSEGDTDVDSSLESIPNAIRLTTPLHNLPLTRSSSTSSLPCTNIEESWFITPPPCFTSAGPVHMETSPLENLLIEHPSMSVYQHSSSVALVAASARRRNSLPISPCPSPVPSVSLDADIQVIEVEERLREALAERLEDRRVQVPQVAPRRGNVDTLRQQERQCLKIKSAQKSQIHKACQSLKRGYIERNNKAREVNCRNHHQRRGERSQGSVRSNANNNRKC